MNACTVRRDGLESNPEKDTWIEQRRSNCIPPIKEEIIMSVNRFVLNGTSYHGHGAINEIPGIVKAHGFKKAFVASDPDLV